MSKSVVVIGGGVIGLCSAYYLAKAGHKVTLLERGRSGHDCCSLGNAGMVVPSHFEPLAAPGMVAYGMKMMFKKSSPFGIRPSLNPDLINWAWKFARSCTAEHVENSSRLLRDMNMESRRLYLEMNETAQGAFDLETCGLVMLCKTEKALRSESHLAEMAKELQLDVQVLDRTDVQNLETNTKLEAAGAVHFLNDCHLNPNKLTAWLSQQVKDLGVEIKFDVDVAKFVTENGKVKAVQTNQGEIEGDEFVLSAGAWSGKLAKTAGFKMPMQGGKGYSVNIPTVSRPKHCFILVEARIAVTPIGEGIRFAGTMEVVGDDLSVNKAKYQGILNSIPDYMPDFQPHDFSELGVWSGLRPCSADGVPYLGKPKSLNNLTVCTGHSMMGVSLGPVSGMLVADIVSGVSTEIPLEGMRPDRFS